MGGGGAGGRGVVRDMGRGEEEGWGGGRAGWGGEEDWEEGGVTLLYARPGVQG